LRAAALGQLNKEQLIAAFARIDMEHEIREQIGTPMPSVPMGD